MKGFISITNNIVKSHLIETRNCIAEFKIVNYFYSFYLLVILFEPTDFRALRNFLAVRK